MEQSTRPNTVITHLEPLPERVLQPDRDEIHPDLEADTRTALSDHIGSNNLLELRTYLFGEHAGIAVRLCMPADSSLAEAHNRAERIERELLVRFPDLHRVVVHVEPEMTP
jgi:divalent metal cation (Fe/Co/Zn/Cd) transporter